jgi:serine/threonine-protein kinase
MDPPAGTRLHHGDAVSLVVSSGPELVEVPSVRAQGVDAATETLEALGFRVVTQESGTFLGLGYVLSQSPGGGEMAPQGSTITLTLI